MLSRFKQIALPALVAVAVSTHVAGAQTVVDTHNGTATPTCCAWGPYVVGWGYTPTTSFFLESIETRFGLYSGYTYGARTITAEIRSAPGGTILGTTSFASSASVADWIGGSFAPVQLTAGNSYFIQFINVGYDNGGYLGVNATSDPASGEYGDLQYTFGTDPNGPFSSAPGAYDPIIRLTGETVTATPEPATMTLFATGLVSIVGAARRRRKAAQDVA